MFKVNDLKSSTNKGIFDPFVKATMRCPLPWQANDRRPEPLSIFFYNRQFELRYIE